MMPSSRRWGRLIGAVVVASSIFGCTPSNQDLRPSETPTPANSQPRPYGLIAFVSDREGSDGVFLMRPDGSEVRRLTPHDLPPTSHPSWSPDGLRIAFNAGTPSASDIYVINLDGSSLTRLTGQAGGNFYPSWSPDGSRLAFSSNRDGDWDIYVMQEDGSQVRQLVNAPGLDDKPQWTPDGSRVAFATTRNGYPELFAVDPANRKEGPLLAHSIRGINPAWSHDGERLAFNVVTSQGFDIAIMAADGEGRRSVIAGEASEERPRWSPDGRQLAYYSDAAGSWDVYTVDVATGESRALTNTPGFDGQASYQPRAGR